MKNRIKLLILAVAFSGALAEEEITTGIRVYDGRPTQEEIRLAISLNGTPMTMDMIPGETTFARAIEPGKHVMTIASSEGAEILPAGEVNLPEETFVNVIVYSKDGKVGRAEVPVRLAEAKKVKADQASFIFFNNSFPGILNVFFKETSDATQDVALKIEGGKWAKIPTGAAISRISFSNGSEEVEIPLKKLPRAEIVSGRTAILVVSDPRKSGEIRTLDGTKGAFISEDN